MAERSVPWVTSVLWRDDVVDGRAFGDCAGPLGVDVGFALVAGDAGVGAVVDDVEVLGAGGGCGVAERKVEELAEVDEVGGIDVGLADDGDGLAGAVDRSRSVPEWKHVVDGGEVVRGYAVGDFAAAVDGEGGLDGGLGLVRLVLRYERGAVGDSIVAEVADLVACGAAGKVVERGDAGDNRGEGCGDGGIGGVGEVLAPLNGVAMHVGAEGGADHSGGAAEFDEGAGGVDLDAGEVMVRKPGGDAREVTVAGAEGCTEGLRREPLVIGGGGVVLLLVDELLQSRFLLGAALENKDDAAEGGGVGEGTLVELGAGERMSVAGEGGDASVIHGLEDAGAGCGKLRLPERRGRAGEEKSGSRRGDRQSSRDPRHLIIPA